MYKMVIMKKIIEVKNLSYCYPDGTKALDDISLEIFENELIALIGPNGSGKTTLLLHLNGILRAKNGRIRIFGMEINNENLLEIRKNLGIVFQDPEDQLFMPTVFDDVAFGPINMNLSRDEVRKRVEDSLNMVEMQGYEKRSSHHLSFGEKKRISIATALSMKPKILVLDEPTLGLDPWIRKDFLKLIEKLRDHHTVLIATHDLELASLCEKIYLLNKGKIIRDIEKIEKCFIPPLL